MVNVFKLLVAAIIAVAFLALFFTQIYPLFFQTENAEGIIVKNMEVAEIYPGKGVSEVLNFENSTFTGNTFDSANRSVAFECNLDTLCCGMDEECDKKIVWSQRKISFKEKTDVQTTIRCFYEHTIFVCRIYLGKKPAQVEIMKAELKSKIDFDSEKPELDLEIKNAGDSVMASGTITADVFERYSSGSEWKRRYIGSAIVKEEFEKLEPGETMQRKITLNLSTPGNYEIELEVNGENAGFEKMDLAFEATGSGTCAAEICGEPELRSGNCIIRCSCTKCLLSSNCAEKIQSTVTQVAVGTDLRNIALRESDIKALGTNLVEVSLPTDFCQ